MRYMVIYSHQPRNKEGKKLKKTEKLFKYVDAHTKEEAKEIFLRDLIEEGRIKAMNENRKFDEYRFLDDNKIISIVR